jgi:hypothetical protein
VPGAWVFLACLAAWLACLGVYLAAFLAWIAWAAARAPLAPVVVGAGFWLCELARARVSSRRAARPSR